MKADIQLKEEQMSLLKLKDLGKIYVSDNSVAVGIRGVNLEFNIGEFVAVTGMSGSGKTTLLNMISGMDTYEEGELYIEGEPTSHYTQKEWESYRQKYISFVFQDYNIIDSFTVLQNVELALSYIDSPKERRERALELIERVGLTRFKNHRGAKLSGGQKQRTVIARALAKNSPIILADEPTGNLDAKTAKEIVELLAEISKDKLVIVVTHSASELEEYATREIRIFDGSVERDERLKDTAESEKPLILSDTAPKNHIIRRGIELGWHRFKAMPKLSVFMCILMVLAIMGTYFSTIICSEDIVFGNDYYIFENIEGRCVITRRDGKVISEDELEDLADDLDAVSAERYDYLHDLTFAISDTYRDSSGATHRCVKNLVCTVDDGSIKPKAGRAPKKDDEVMLVLPLEWQNIYGKGDIKEFSISIFGSNDFTVTGVDYFYDNTEPYGKAVFTKDGFERCTDIAFLCGALGSGIKADLSNHSGYYPTELRSIFIDEALEGNECYFTTYDSSLISMLDSLNTTSGTADVSVKWIKNNINTSLSYDYDCGTMLLLHNKCKTLRVSYKDEYIINDGEVIDMSSANAAAGLYISQEMADALLQNLRNENYGQASLYFENDREAKRAAESLKSEGYYAVPAYEKYEDSSNMLLTFIVSVMMLGIWIMMLLFIGFFLYICSARAIIAKRGDIAILRSMGIENRIIKISMYAQTAIAMLPSFVVLAVSAMILYLVPSNNSIFPFMQPWQYVMIVIGMIILNFFISSKYNKRMFKKSVRKTLKGGDKE